MTDEEIYELEREVFPHYCKDGIIKCSNPYHSHSDDEKIATELWVLSISRIDGDKYRPIFCKNVKLLKKLKRENYPSGYQVLCENCQMEKMNSQWGRQYWYVGGISKR